MRTVLLASVSIASIASAQPAPDAGEPATPPAAAEPAPPVAEPAPPPPAEPPPVEKKEGGVSVSYDHGVKIETEDKRFEAKLNLKSQLRFESVRPTEDDSQFANNFFIARARLGLGGYLFGKDNIYKTELALGDSGGFSFLKDIYYERKATDALYVRFGQWKRPFNRAEMTSDFSGQMNERSIQNELAGGGRSLGIAVHNNYEKSPEGLEWVVGVFNDFNGGSDRPTVTTLCTQDPLTGKITCANAKPQNYPKDFGPTAVVRVGWNSANMKGYSEGDHEGGPLRYAIGASYKVDFANFAKGAAMSVGENMQHGVEVDGMVKVQGFAVGVGGVVMKQRNPAGTASTTDYGFFVQPSEMILDKKAEVVGRFAMVTVADNTRKQLEARVGFNWFLGGHDLKVVTDLGFLYFTGMDATGATDKPDLDFRAMLQFVL